MLAACPLLPLAKVGVHIVVFHFISHPMISLKEITEFLYQGDSHEIARAIAVGSFDHTIPGMQLLAGCDQGQVKHLEGDVAVHTALVVANILRIASKQSDFSLDSIDLLAALIHDLEKPSTRIELEDGRVRFPNHAAKAAERIESIAKTLDLTAEQQQKLYYLVAEHSDAANIASATLDVQKKVVLSPYWKSMRILQKADAMACYLNKQGTVYAPVRWGLLTDLRRFWEYRTAREG